MSANMYSTSVTLSLKLFFTSTQPMKPVPSSAVAPSLVAQWVADSVVQVIPSFVL
jgi:hypothetical protein